MLDRLQTQYPGQFSDSAIRGYAKRVPQDTSLLDESSLNSLVQLNGPIYFMCGGWGCQSMSLEGKEKGMNDKTFAYFLDMIRIVNYIQLEQQPRPLYLFENTYPGKPRQYPNVDKAAE